jgi:hypothetical protein
MLFATSFAVDIRGTARISTVAAVALWGPIFARPALADGEDPAPRSSASSDVRVVPPARRRPRSPPKKVAVSEQAAPATPVTPETTAPPERDSACSGGSACGADRDTKFTAGAELDFDSRFIWRGLALSSGPIAQPAAWASAYRFSAIVWTSLLLTDEPPHRRVRSVVPSLAYTYSWDRFKIEPGVLFYWIGDELAPRTTAEAYLNGDVAFGKVHLVSENYFDVVDYPGAYFGSIGPQVEISRDPWTFKGTFDLGFATADYNKAYFGVDGPALNVAEAGVEVRWDMTEHLYATLHSEGSVLLAPGLWRSVNEPALVSIGTAFGAEL